MLGWVLVGAAAIGASLLLVYPVLLYALTRGTPRSQQTRADLHLSVSILIVARNAEALVVPKVRNTLALDSVEAPVEVVIVSDGSTDRTVERLKLEAEQARFILLAYEAHRGKAHALNDGLTRCSGDIVVFTDVDAELEPSGLGRLLQPFADEGIGGVCGQRVFKRDRAAFDDAQARYIGADSIVKRLESRIGSITSNDGKLYAVRRELCTPVPEAVTDDLYNCLSVVSSRRRFVFEPSALAFIPVPSRSARHELERRRRVVCRSLRGIALMRHLLNPARFGLFAIGLAINKVNRRLLPLHLTVLLAGSMVLALSGESIGVLLLVMQGGFYGAALMYPLVERIEIGGEWLRRLCSVSAYFCLGNIGTALGVSDFLGRRAPVKWEPRKST